MNKPFTYVAVPYSHFDTTVMHERFLAVNKFAGELTQKGLIVISPISQNHPIAQAAKLPTGWEYWEKVDRALLEYCNAIYVLCLEGWQESEGVKAEIKIAIEMNIPIYYIYENE